MRSTCCVLVTALLCAALVTSFVSGSSAAEGARSKPATMNIDRLKGMKAAVADLEKGKLKLRSLPLPDAAWQQQYIDLLRSEYGVAWETTDDVSEPLGRELLGYNDVMRAEIEHRFGQDALQTLQKKAEADFRKASGR